MSNIHAISPSDSSTGLLELVRAFPHYAPPDHVLIESSSIVIPCYLE